MDKSLKYKEEKLEAQADFQSFLDFLDKHKGDAGLNGEWAAAIQSTIEFSNEDGTPNKVSATFTKELNPDLFGGDFRSVVKEIFEGFIKDIEDPDRLEVFEGRVVIEFAEGSVNVTFDKEKQVG